MKKRLKILAVDDDEQARVALSEYLTMLGHEVSVASDEQTAWKMLNIPGENGFDIVISDVCMPGGSGIELLGRIREKDRELPVVLMTGYDTMRRLATQLANRESTCRILPKPINVEELSNYIERLCVESMEHSVPDEDPEEQTGKAQQSENKKQTGGMDMMDAELAKAKKADAATQTDDSLIELAGKYLTFKLGEEDYGLEILKVQEIIKMQEITKVPRTPDFMRGVINLRGKVIPVVDLRLKFGMEEHETTDMTCIIVLQVSSENGSVTMGVVVDEVSEVLDIAGEDIEPTPSLGTTVDTAFVMAMAKTKESVKMLLDIDKVLSAAEIAALSAAA